MGMDFDFLMLNVCVLCFVENLARFYPLLRSRIMMGVLVAYLVDKSLISVRSYMGRRNLAKHTLVDEAFLI